MEKWSYGSWDPCYNPDNNPQDTPATQKQLGLWSQKVIHLLPWLIIATGHMNYPYLFHFTKKSKQDKTNYNMQTEICGYNGKLQIFKTRQNDLRIHKHALPDRKNLLENMETVHFRWVALYSMNILFKKHCLQPVFPSPIAQGKHFKHLFQAWIQRISSFEQVCIWDSSSWGPKKVCLASQVAQTFS